MTLEKQQRKLHNLDEIFEIKPHKCIKKLATRKKKKKLYREPTTLFSEKDNDFKISLDRATTATTFPFQAQLDYPIWVKRIWGVWKP